MTLSPGSRLGPYRIVALIGAGGMGVVYRAHDEKLGRDLALKVLPPETMADETARARLIREARTASSLNHPRIAHIYEVGEDQGNLFIAMELIEGDPLSKLIQKGGIPAESALNYAHQIADALAYAHQRDVVHRDLKCANVMVTPEGWIKILDFGLAKRLEERPEEDSRHELNLTATGLVLGTPNYLPPEVLTGGRADARSDVWALGVMLYEMVTGKLPFGGGSVGKLAEAILNTAPSPVSGRVPVGLRAVIERCLAKEPSARYQNGAEVLAAIKVLQRPSGWKPPGGALQRIGIPALLSVLLLAAAVAFATGKIRLPWAGGGSGDGAAPKINSLAVLPLANLSGDPTQEYFADGMTEELITDLASIKNLKVISRTSAMRYKGSKKSLREIARELRVDGIVEGSVLRAGERVRITAQLIEASSDQHLWARSYERDFKDVLTLQSEVARDIAGEIRMQVTPQEQVRLAKRTSVNPQAYDLYLKGRYEWGKVTPEGLDKAIEYFQRARALDPDDARYSSGIADAYLVRVQIIGDMPMMEGMTKVKEYAGRALKADKQSAEAYASMGAAILFWDWDWKKAELLIQQSIDLNPGYSTARIIYAAMLCAAGRHDEAIEQQRIAEELDPMSLIVQWHAASVYYNAHRFDEALAKAKKLVQMFPTSPLVQGTLFKAHEARGEYKEALDVFDRYQPKEGEQRTALAKLRKAFETGGPTGYWRTMLEMESLGDSPGKSMRLAMVYAKLGETDKSIQQIEKAFREHSSDLLFMNSEPYFDSVRGDPRFQAMVRRVGLTPRA